MAPGIDPRSLAGTLYRAFGSTEAAPAEPAAEAIDIARAAGVPIEVYWDAYDPDYRRRPAGCAGLFGRGADPRAVR